MLRLHLPASAPYAFSFVRIAHIGTGRIEQALLSATLPRDLRLADGRDARLLHRLRPHLARRHRARHLPEEPECVLLCERLGHAYLVSAEEARDWGFPVPPPAG